jgi:SRSO17 transposase
MAAAMLEEARRAGSLESRWVTGDEAYGQVPEFRDELDAAGWWYVLEVPRTTPLFRHPSEAAVPAWSGRGRKPIQPRLLPGEAQSVVAIAAALAETAWQTLTVAEGAHGPRTYQFVALRGWESRAGIPGRACWLVLRRNLDGSELKYFLSNAPHDTPLATLGQVGAFRWSIETEFQQGKGYAGLDEYEVRGWRGWEHHITLALLAGAFLLSLEQDWGEKDAGVDPPPGQSAPADPPPPAPLDAGGVGHLAHHDPALQRACQTFPRQTASPPAA